MCFTNSACPRAERRTRATMRRHTRGESFGVADPFPLTWQGVPIEGIENRPELISTRQCPRRSTPASTGKTEGAGSRETGLVAASDPYRCREGGDPGPRSVGVMTEPTVVMPSLSHRIAGISVDARPKGERRKGRSRRSPHSSADGRLSSRARLRWEHWGGPAGEVDTGNGTFTCRHQDQLAAGAVSGVAAH